MMLVLVLILSLVSLQTTPGASTPEPVVEPLPFELETELITRVSHNGTSGTLTWAASADSLLRIDDSGTVTRVGDAPAEGRIVHAIDNPDVLMVGDEANCFQGGGGFVLQVSTDAGATWTASQDLLVRPLAIWSEAGLAIGADCGGLVVSKDLGLTWEPLHPDLLGFNVTAFTVSHDHTIVAGLTGEGGTSRLYEINLDDLSTVSATSWIREYYGIGAVAATDEVIYLVNMQGVNWTTDGGTTWYTERTGLEDVTADFDLITEGFPIGFDPTGMGLSAIWLTSTGMPLVIGGDSAVFQYLNTDVQKSTYPLWEPVGTTPARVTGFVGMPDGESMIVETETGLLIMKPTAWNV